mgnify:CR=1 FL=1
MSTFKVSIEKVVKVDNHPNADKLDIIQVLGWNLITAKNNFKEGDLCIYFPIDSILSSLVEIKLFGEGSKIKLSNHRIRTIKLRGAISQGLAAKFDLFKDELTGMSLKEGVDLTSKLYINFFMEGSHIVDVSGNSLFFIGPEKSEKPEFPPAQRYGAPPG